MIYFTISHSFALFISHLVCYVSWGMRKRIWALAAGWAMINYYYNPTRCSLRISMARVKYVCISVLSLIFCPVLYHLCMDDYLSLHQHQVIHLILFVWVLVITLKQVCAMCRVESTHKTGCLDGWVVVGRLSLLAAERPSIDWLTKPSVVVAASLECKQPPILVEKMTAWEDGGASVAPKL